eukprot:6361292-Prymnesium_polylepis.1
MPPANVPNTHNERIHRGQTRQLLAFVSTDAGASEADCSDCATSRMQYYTPGTRLEGIQQGFAHTCLHGTAHGQQRATRMGTPETPHMPPIRHRGAMLLPAVRRIISAPQTLTAVAPPNRH